MRVSLSLWSADLADLRSEIRRADPFVDSFHLDVGDGRFVPLLLFFPDMVRAIRSATTKPLEIHLMVQDPERWIQPFAEAGADAIVFSPDATDDPRSTLARIKEMGLRVGLCSRIEAPASVLVPYLADIDIVLVMGTPMGVKGIARLANVAVSNVRELARHRAAFGFEIIADGAIRTETVPILRDAGVTGVVAGSLIFSNDMAAINKWLKSL